MILSHTGNADICGAIGNNVTNRLRRLINFSLVCSICVQTTRVKRLKWNLNCNSSSNNWDKNFFMTPYDFEQEHSFLNHVQQKRASSACDYLHIFSLCMFNRSIVCSWKFIEISKIDILSTWFIIQAGLQIRYASCEPAKSETSSNKHAISVNCVFFALAEMRGKKSSLVSIKKSA